MRHRRTLLAAAAIAVLAGSGCSDEPDTPPAAAPVPSATASSTPAPVSSAATSAADAPAPGIPAEPARPNAKSGATPALSVPKGTARPAGPVVLSAKGLGPYRVGGAHQAMKAAGLLGEPVSVKGCSGYTIAAGRSDLYAPKVVFHQGALQYVSVTSTKVSTAEGARVGMSLADVQARYPQGRQLEDWVGATAWIATSGSDALLFHVTKGAVSSIEAGRAQPLQVRFTDGDGC